MLMALFFLRSKGDSGFKLERTLTRKDEMRMEKGAIEKPVEETVVTTEEPNWLLQPSLPQDLQSHMAEIGQAEEITPEVLQALERELEEAQRSATRPQELDLDCQRLKECGSFSGGCPNLVKCGGYG